MTSYTNIPKDVERPLEQQEPREKLNKKDKMISPAVSYWIKCVRAWMTVMVLTYHQSTQIPTNMQFPLNTPLKWINVMLPHPLAGSGEVAVNVFFGLAAFLGFHSFEKLYAKTKDNTKEFLKEFGLKFAKRWLQMRIPILLLDFVFSPLSYIVFGSKPILEHKFLATSLNYWLDTYLPIFWPGRSKRQVAPIHKATWFVYEMINIEFVYWTIFFLNYFIRRKLDLSFWYICGLIAVFIGVTVPCQMFLAGFQTGYTQYCIGLIVYLLKYVVVNNKSFDYFSWISSDQKTAKTTRLALMIALALLFQIIGRAAPTYSQVLLLVPLLFDILPSKTFKDLKLILVQEIIEFTNTYSFSIYIFQSTFLLEYVPKYWPILTPVRPNDTFAMSAPYVGWFYAIPLLALYGIMGFLLDKLTQPLIEILDWKAEKREKTKKIVHLAIVLAISIVVIILVQTGVFGFEQGVRNPNWPPPF